MADQRAYDKQQNKNQTTQGRPGQAAGESGRSGVHAAQAGAEEASRAFGRSADAGAEAIRQSADTAAEAQAAGGERMRKASEMIAEGQRRIGHVAFDGIAESGRKAADLARDGADDFRLLMTLPACACNGTQDFHRNMNGLLEGVLQTNVRLAEDMLQLANLVPVVEMQRRFIDHYFGALMEGSASILRVMRQTSDQSLQPLEAHLEQRRARVSAALHE
jgi:hypothetical protein